MPNSDPFVDALAARTALFDKPVMAEIKRLREPEQSARRQRKLPRVGRVSHLAAAARDPSADRARFERGFHEPRDVERRLGYYVGNW